MLGRMRIDAERKTILSLWKVSTALGRRVLASTPFLVQRSVWSHQGEITRNELVIETSEPQKNTALLSRAKASWVWPEVWLGP